LRELVARIRAVLRRGSGAGVGVGEADTSVDTSPSDHEVISVGDVALDLDAHTVRVGGEPVALPLKEFDLLHVLIANAGRVMPREMLIDKVWGHDYVGDTKTLDVHIKRLRAKIEAEPADPCRIITIRGLGYKYQRV
jgi:two-component system response regulator RegX3